MDLTECIGAFVVTSDGRELGRIKRVQSHAFLVDAPLQFDYWLETDRVTAGDAERVELNIHSSQLGAYKMDRPNDPDEFQSVPNDALTPTGIRGTLLGL